MPEIRLERLGSGRVVMATVLAYRLFALNAGGSNDAGRIGVTAGSAPSAAHAGKKN